MMMLSLFLLMLEMYPPPSSKGYIDMGIFNLAAIFNLKPLPFARCCNREPWRCRSGTANDSTVSRG